MTKIGTQLEEHDGHVIVPLLSLEKQARGGSTILYDSPVQHFYFAVSNIARVRGYLRIPRFLEDPSLCPATTLIDYLNKVG